MFQRWPVGRECRKYVLILPGWLGKLPACLSVSNCPGILDTEAQGSDVTCSSKGLDTRSHFTCQVARCSTALGSDLLFHCSCSLIVGMVFTSSLCVLKWLNIIWEVPHTPQPPSLGYIFVCVPVCLFVCLCISLLCNCFEIICYIRTAEKRLDLGVFISLSFVWVSVLSMHSLNIFLIRFGFFHFTFCVCMCVLSMHMKCVTFLECLAPLHWPKALCNPTEKCDEKPYSMSIHTCCVFDGQLSREPVKFLKERGVIKMSQAAELWTVLERLDDKVESLWEGNVSDVHVCFCLPPAGGLWRRCWHMW